MSQTDRGADGPIPAVPSRPAVKLYAISDLHLGHEANRRAFEALPEQPCDWLILAGDVGESEDHLALALRTATARFSRVIWVPGNHELWTTDKAPGAPRGHAKYLRMVDVCRHYGVLTPEDPYAIWPGAPEPCAIAPLFLLYDYSFRPDDVPEDKALAWAAEAGLVCTDEMLLHPDPYPSRAAWCAARCEWTAARLEETARTHRTVLINHFPLRRELAWLPAIPRFSIWCGTRRTEEWHMRFRARVVVSGHLHIRSTTVRDGVRFEEVSLGYPRQWHRDRPIETFLREILPGPR